MLFQFSILFLVTFHGLIHAYDLSVDLATGITYDKKWLMKSVFDDDDFSDYPEDCAAIYTSAKLDERKVKSGVYDIWPREGKPFKVFCDMEIDGGGWTLIQRRDDYERQEDFYRTWLEYKRGFGHLNREFWLGNDRISILTNQNIYNIRFDLKDFDGEERFAEYHNIHVSNEYNKYRMTVQSYIKGNAGDSFLANHTNSQFSTKDQDNDQDLEDSCANLYKGGWWYKNCHGSNLNGLYLHGKNKQDGEGVNWLTFRGYNYSLKKTEIKIRPAWFKP